MAVTRSKSAERAEVRSHRGGRAVWRRKESALALVAALLTALGLSMVYKAKARIFTDVESGLAAKTILNLNELKAREDLLPALSIFSDTSERELAARKIYYVGGGLSNVGAIGRIRVEAAEIKSGRGLRSLRERLGTRESMPLLNAEQVRDLKPLFVVRHPERFKSAFRLWGSLFFVAFLLAHAWLCLSGSRSDQYILPAVLLLSGIGLILMVSLRDPVRDNMLFVDFAQGAAGGAILLALASGLDFQRLFGKLSFVPLLGSFALSAMLILFGSGPGTSDAKVNLLGFQPVEVIRLLLILFLAGYFAQRWDVLRHARETRASVAALTRRFDIPPLEYTIPVFVSVALSLVFFFLQKDMGPALVFACLFLALYAIARGSALVPLAGLGVLAAGFAAGAAIGFPNNVAARVSMWLSPWDNTARGGDQLAHSLWAFATGGVTGAGVGLGDPQLVPAAHTDLILSALGEEWGFIGVMVAFALYAFIAYRALRIAAGARTDYEFFLGAGLACATVVQFLLISGGALGIVPLTGVVTPFLSYGRSSMLVNFVVVGMLLSISARGAGGVTGEERAARPFVRQIKVAGVVFAVVAGVALCKAAYVQVAQSAAVMGRGTLVVQGDGARRYQYNPRFLLVMAEIPKGSVYDSNDLPLATSDWAELEKNRARYSQLGIDINRACKRTDSRHYPFGALMFDLLGDVRTRDRWAASNTAFIERDSSRRLRGFDDRPTVVEVKDPRTGQMARTVRYDYRELVPLLRHRYEPNHPEVRQILDRPRDVRVSIDARLQLRVAQALKAQLQALGKEKGSAVVLDPSTGDLLAAVSYPLPAPGEDVSKGDDGRSDKDNENEEAKYLDRARFGLYPPGSTFKIVTAMAALRKDPGLATKTHGCIRLPDGRVGNYLKGVQRPIRDDVQDKSPHGEVNMERGIVASCNAYFAQLATYDVGADALFDTANRLGILTAAPNTAEQLRKSLAQSGYGQGQVVASPFQMARAAATIANGGVMAQGRWITDETNPRTNQAQSVLDGGSAQLLARFMRGVVTSGTGKRASAGIPIAGKTGTAELANAPSHGWFIGFAPYASPGRKIAFSVLVENGVYGGTAAAPVAPEIVRAAADLGLIQP